MEKFKHTPGPWIAKHVSGANFAVQQFDICAKFGDTPHIYPIFNRDLAGIDGQTVFVSPSDAFLIAAAPDLLSALRAILAVSERHSDVAFNIISDTATYAIAKAEGDL